MEKENKPLFEKGGFVSCREDVSDSNWNMEQEEVFWETDVKQAVREAYEEITGLCYDLDIDMHKRIFKDKFGFEL